MRNLKVLEREQNKNYRDEKSEMLEFHAKAWLAKDEADFQLKFNSELELREWVKSVGAKEFARDNHTRP